MFSNQLDYCAVYLCTCVCLCVCCSLSFRRRVFFGPATTAKILWYTLSVLHLWHNVPIYCLFCLCDLTAWWKITRAWKSLQKSLLRTTVGINWWRLSIIMEEHRIVAIIQRSYARITLGINVVTRTLLKLHCKPIAYLFNLSITERFVPQQWKTAWISPIPEVSAPQSHTDYRPISITSILSRMWNVLLFVSSYTRYF